jgi:hypothetical protein
MSNYKPTAELLTFVARFPAQEHIGGDSKIPSILYYDLHGTLRSVGAETREFQEQIIEDETEDQHQKVEWYPFLRSLSMYSVAHNTRPLSPFQQV